MTAEKQKKEHIFVVKQNFGNNKNLAATFGNFRIKYGQNSDLNLSIVKRQLQTLKRVEHLVILKSCSTRNNKAVRGSIAERSETLFLRRSFIAYSYRRFSSSKLQWPTDHVQRRGFVVWIMEQKRRY